MDEWEDIRDEIVYFLTEKKWLGYPTYTEVTKKRVVRILKPRVLKIVHHIYTRGLCVFLFMNSVTEAELWEIVRS